MNIQQNLHNASTQLTGKSDSPQLDAEILLAHALHKSRTFLFTWPEHEVNTSTQQHFEQLVTQRLAGHPVAHIIGQREFWSLNLHITADTLIPRPETELLVEHILKTLPATPQNIADLGTGSGAIAIALASGRPQWKITATDKSPAALEIARSNAQLHHLNNIDFVQGDWFTPLTHHCYHAIISNPPYIAENNVHLTRGDVRFEPPGALTSGHDGLHDIRHIAQHAIGYLLAGGLLMVEHGYDQMSQVKEIFQNNHYVNIVQLLDLNGNPRSTLGYKP